MLAEALDEMVEGLRRCGPLAAVLRNLLRLVGPPTARRGHGPTAGRQVQQGGGEMVERVGLAPRRRPGERDRGDDGAGAVCGPNAGVVALAPGDRPSGT